MKLFVVTLSLLAAPAFSQAETCYKAMDYVPYEVPGTICFSELNVTADDQNIEVISPDGSAPAVLTIVKTSRHNEDKLNFVAQATMVDVWESGCGSGLSAVLNVAGRIEFGTIYPAALKVSVDVASTSDTCHSSEQKYSVQYAEIK
ncbi:hypothetical protein EZJ49_02375 [Bdellovibrio bacteriovorus]|uniref:hypothetical protein n=1 Tax=Bdellovibrio bacteriovorus TaxID=959 RepID=UPI0021CF0001|nr:hypothetical protein [Bdellovibrio bacteriovorus]UXR65092.1 hypothetical protein EZJ49_02375 [Bdellovibrio bacteriovorus]